MVELLMMMAYSLNKSRLSFFYSPTLTASL